MSLLVADSLCVHAAGTALLQDVSFSVGEGELVALLGPSGAGKSTLLAAICGNRVPSSGRIEVSSSVGFVPQAPLDTASPLCVGEIVALSRPRLGLRTSRSERFEVSRLLERLDLADVSDRRLAQLSGGQRQRVAIASALMLGAGLIVCDEPTSGADPSLAGDLLDLLRALTSTGTSVILATHDTHRVLPVVDRVLALREGRLVLDASSSPVPDLSGVYARGQR